MLSNLDLCGNSNLYIHADDTPAPQPAAKPQNATPVELKIPFETLSLLMVIAQRVGGDFGMQVRIGEAGAGSFFDTAACTITLDPLHVIENPSSALFVAFHEGMHRRITPGVQEMGLSKQDAKKLFERLGFLALYNCLEDTAVNTAGVQIFPNMAPHMKSFYDQQFTEENAKLGIPEEFLLSSMLGYWPKFAKFCSELIRDWHQGRFSRELDADVLDTLNVTIGKFHTAKELIPSPRTKSFKEMIRRAQERLELANELYPHLDKLIAIDKEVEAYRQMVQEFRKTENSISSLEQAAQEAWKNEEGDKARELERQADKLKRDLDPWASLPEEQKKLLKEALEKALKEQLERIAQEMQRLENQIMDAQEKQQALKQELESLAQQMQDAQGEEAAKLGERMEQAQQELAMQQGLEKQAAEALEALKAGVTQSMLNGSMPMPWDQLSNELKQLLEDLFNSLSKQKQSDLKKKAQRQLENIEDKLNDELEGQLNEDRPENHAAQNRRRTAQRDVDDLSSTDRSSHERLSTELRAQREEKMTDYDRAFRDLAPLLNAVYRRLEDVFIREKITDWIPGYPSGSKVSLERAMQGEADPNMHGKMWQRRVIPGEKDEAFVVLVDVSGSMGSEGKFWETFKASIILGELFARLNTPAEFLSFSDDVRYVKRFEESIQDGDVRSRFNSLVNQRGGTDDVRALKVSHHHLVQHPAQYKFVLMLSDAGSNYWREHNRLMAKIKARKEVVVVHFGVGPGTSDTHNLYPYSYGDLKVSLTPKQRKEGEKDFCDVLCDVVEDIVLRPETYLQYADAQLEH